LGNGERAGLHRRLHVRYKPDDNAQELAVNAARLRYPAANVASEPLVIYPLNREGAPGLPQRFARRKPAPQPAGARPAAEAAALEPAAKTTGDAS
jgi:hypothetical protein